MTASFKYPQVMHPSDESKYGILNQSKSKEPYNSVLMEGTKSFHRNLACSRGWDPRMLDRKMTPELSKLFIPCDQQPRWHPPWARTGGPGGPTPPWLEAGSSASSAVSSLRGSASALQLQTLARPEPKTLKRSPSAA
jgi:hypothetical protein